MPTTTTAPHTMYRPPEGRSPRRDRRKHIVLVSTKTCQLLQHLHPLFACTASGASAYYWYRLRPRDGGFRLLQEIHHCKKYTKTGNFRLFSRQKAPVEPKVGSHGAHQIFPRSLPSLLPTPHVQQQHHTRPLFRLEYWCPVHSQNITAACLGNLSND